jgi:hypothetical protein
MSRFEKSFLFVVLAPLLAGVGCTRPSAPSPERARLRAEIRQLEQQDAAMDDRIREAKRVDPGLERQLVQDRDLLRSRLARLRERLHQRKKRPPENFVVVPPPE